MCQCTFFFILSFLFLISTKVPCSTNHLLRLYFNVEKRLHGTSAYGTFVALCSQALCAIAAQAHVTTWKNCRVSRI